MPEIFRFLVFHSFSIAENMNQFTYMWKVQKALQSIIMTEKTSFYLSVEDKKNNELKKIKFVIDENKDIIISRWKEYFEK